MHSEINEKIEQTQRGIVRLHKLDSILKQLELEQENLRQKESELKGILEKESYDVEKLEHMSIASVFYSILGNLDEHVDKERREALAAKLRYDQVVKDLEDGKYQISKLILERLNYVDCQKEYDRLCTQKKEELLQENGETAKRIFELTDKLNLSKFNLEEIREATSAGNEVLDSLNIVLSSLASAEGWGTWDLLGGGFISDLAKHSHIDDAKAEVEDTQRLIRKFKTELTDIRISSEIVMEIDGFAKFADFFFDGLIADWFMQSQINESQRNVESVKSQVVSIVSKFEHMKDHELANIERLEAEINELIVKA
ncbi:hypothetical protein [Desulfitobacterium metallireducens]|uniref:Uncharacterized protein n=1 Tax=Desulfitobacterium metallireducens DSM 15288 TaxID=871968 RepID=W0EAQ2_9FIRM|nr:hypothetical protein [Desulfitobacterium metallireducens]AHF06136.1 hypothetical protein DESME_03000 [Desulfitobacterium metallireducens DSM 15288]